MFRDRLECLCTIIIFVCSIFIWSVSLFMIVTGRPEQLLYRSFDSVKYRGAQIYWEEGYPLPDEKLEIFYIVVDSLTDDVHVKYSIAENRMRVYYLAKEETFGSLEGTEGATAFYRRATNAFGKGAADNIFLSKTLIESDNNSFAMALVHEYLHMIQHSVPGYIEEYALDVGWLQEGETFYHPVEDPDFFMVLTDYSLTSPFEDMSDTFMFSYLCVIELESLSEARNQHIDNFWSIPREEYCRNFH